jgi:hypothetical protein
MLEHHIPHLLTSVPEFQRAVIIFVNHVTSVFAAPSCYEKKKPSIFFSNKKMATLTKNIVLPTTNIFLSTTCNNF